MWETWKAMTSKVLQRPISRNRVSPVASNCKRAEPNWNPYVHSVQPRAVYRPLTVKTGVPWAGFQVFSRASLAGGEIKNPAQFGQKLLRGQMGAVIVYHA